MRIAIFTSLTLVLLMAGCQKAIDAFGTDKNVPVTKSKWSTAEEWPEAQQKAPSTQPEADPQIMATPKAAGASLAAPAAGRASEKETPKPIAGDASPAATGEMSAAILRIKDTYITARELVAKADAPLKKYARGRGVREYRQVAKQVLAAQLMGFLNDELIQNEAASRLSEQHTQGIDIEVDKHRNKLIAEVGGSQTALESKLLTEGRTLEKVLKDFRNTLSVEVYMQMRLLPTIHVSRKMMMRYYKEHQNEFAHEKHVQMQMIAAPLHKFLKKTDRFTNVAEDQARLKAEAKKVIDLAKRRIDSGEAFGKVASELSRGLKAKSNGIWPIMPLGSIKESAIEKKAFSMKQGQVSDVMETESGYYIVKAYKVFPGKVDNFEQAQTKIRHAIRMKRYEKLTAEFRQRFAKQAEAYYDENFVNEAVEVAVAKYLSR